MEEQRLVSEKHQVRIAIGTRSVGLCRDFMSRERVNSVSFHLLSAGSFPDLRQVDWLLCSGLFLAYYHPHRFF